MGASLVLNLGLSLPESVPAPIKCDHDMNKTNIADPLGQDPG